MSDDVKWVRIATDMFDNRKIKQIRKLPDGDSLVIIWIHLICLAGSTNDSGRIYLTEEVPYTDQMLADACDEPLHTVQLALGTFARFGMIDMIDDIIHISNWEKYQNTEGLDRIREQNRLRKQNQRMRDKARRLLTEGDEVKKNDASRDSHVTVTQQDKEIDIEKDIYITGDAEMPSKEALAAEFEEVWRYFPRKKGKDDARKAYIKHRTNKEDPSTFEEVLHAARNMAKQCEGFSQEDMSHIPYGSTWFNQRRWKDEDQSINRFWKREPRATRTEESLGYADSDDGLGDLFG